jgi:hypothetical protein
MNNTPTIELEVVNLETMTDEIKLWVSKLQYLEVEDLRSIIQTMDKCLKKSSDELNDMKQTANENIRNLSFKKYVRVSNGK